MSAEPIHSAAAGDAAPGENLRAIRAALTVPEDREAFDAGLERVLDEVRADLDLGPLMEFVHLWWLTACDCVRDPDGRRRMHATAARIQAGQVPAGRPVREVLAEREARG